MVGIVFSFDKDSDEIQRLLRFLNHRGDTQTVESFTCPDYSGKTTLVFGIVHSKDECAIFRKDGGITILDSLFHISPQKLIQIEDTIMKGPTSETEEDVLMEMQGVIIISTTPEGIMTWRSIDGQKVLYYGNSSSSILLSTEKKVLWSMGCEEVKPILPGHRVCISPKKTSHIHTIPSFNWRIWKGDQDQALKLLGKHLVKSIERLKGLNCGILFSGGVDSSLLAHILKETSSSVQLFSASYGESRDSSHANYAAELLGIPIKTIEMTPDMIWKSLPKIIYAIESSNQMDVEIALPFYFSSMAAKESGIEMIVSGQGPDELFAGYARHVRILESEGPSSLENMLREDFSITHEANIARDERIVSINGLDIHFPYLDPRFSELALSLPVTWKIQPSRKPERKVIFRKLARDLGLDIALSNAPKKATQFSSGSSKGIRTAVVAHVKACRDMTTTMIDSIVQVVLKELGYYLGQPDGMLSTADLGIDLDPTKKLSESLKY